jgi:phosphatidylserine/phosphatidylglycerophosphate/cardiolipin synthase-like enzyme
MTHPFTPERVWPSRRLLTAAVVLAAAVLWPRPAAALERFCDPAFEDCRQPLIDMIDRETVGIDVGFWFMEDARYSSALQRAAARGLPIRVLMDTRANSDYPGNIFCLDQIKQAGIPMREKIDGGILHWKMMLFIGQKTVEFSGANYSAEAFVPQTPWSAYVDEVIYFTDRTSYVNSFMTKFDDVWTSPTGYRDYANVTTVVRKYATFPIDPELNFPPGGFRERSVADYAAEPKRINTSMYRITDRAHSDALIAAMQKGTPSRIITEQLQYREESRLWHAWNVDRMWLAGQQNRIGGEPGIHIRVRGHDGLSHEKLTVLEGLGTVIFGSSNWTSPSADDQLEHNLFTTNPTFYTWSKTHFDRKWNNLAPSKETAPFVPLPPDIPQLVSPAAGATNQATSVTFTWNAGPWAHKYDLYLGTSPANLTKVIDDNELGPYTPTWTVQNLLPATVYYWRVVSRTMANLSRTSQICSFKTAGAGGGTVSTACSPGPANPPDPTLVLEPQDISPNTGSVTGNGPGTGSGGQSTSGGSSTPGMPPSRTPSANGTFTGLRAVPRD